MRVVEKLAGPREVFLKEMLHYCLLNACNPLPQSSRCSCSTPLPPSSCPKDARGTWIQSTGGRIPMKQHPINFLGLYKIKWIPGNNMWPCLADYCRLCPTDVEIRVDMSGKLIWHACRHFATPIFSEWVWLLPPGYNEKNKCFPYGNWKVSSESLTMCILTRHE